MATIGNVMEALQQRLYGDEDARARARGWTVQRTGLFGLGRVYHDSRWTPHAARAKAQNDRMGETVTSGVDPLTSVNTATFDAAGVGSASAPAA